MKAILVLSLILAAVPASAGIITNGTFDTNTTGWTFASADGNTWWNLGGAHGGFAVLNNSPGWVPSMTQSVTLVTGHNYQLTWDMISPYHCCSSGTTPGAGAAIDGHLWEFIVTYSQPWLSYSETFVYSGGSATLEFTSQRNGTDTDVGIDNVVLTDLGQSDVPEPGTAALVLGALALVVFGRRHA